jgi:hypothetical protein
MTFNIFENAGDKVFDQVSGFPGTKRTIPLGFRKRSFDYEERMNMVELEILRYHKLRKFRCFAGLSEGYDLQVCSPTMER